MACDRAVVRAARMRSPSAADAPAGSPRTPLELTARTPPARSSGMICASGRVSPGAARSSRTSPGASASMTDVSKRPACGSAAGRPAAASEAGGRPACQAWHGRPSASSRRRAASIAAMLPPCPFTSSIAGQCRLAWRPSSTSSSVRASVPIDSVPGKAACSPLAPMATAGASPAQGRPAQARDATSIAIRVSVSIGRCGPCCSHDPVGTTSSRRGPASTCGQRSAPRSSMAIIIAPRGPAVSRGIARAAQPQHRVQPGLRRSRRGK
jgi:hypothetical protein